MFKKLTSYIRGWTEYSTIRLVGEGAFLTFFPKVIFILLLAFVLIAFPGLLDGTLPEKEDWDLVSKLVLIGIVSIVIPPIETLLGQYLPILIASKFTNRPVLIIIGSAIVFAIPHISPIGILHAFWVGIILSTLFYQLKKTSPLKAFCIVTIIHGLHNLITSSIALFVFNANIL
jgi:hypothetical protein